MKDQQFRDILRLNGKLQELGNNLVSSIKNYGAYSKNGMSLNMKSAVEAWEDELQKNYTKVH